MQLLQAQTALDAMMLEDDLPENAPGEDITVADQSHLLDSWVCHTFGLVQVGEAFMCAARDVTTFDSCPFNCRLALP